MTRVDEGQREVVRLVELERRLQALRDDYDGERDGEALEPDPPEGVLRLAESVSGRWRLGHEGGVAGLHYRIHPAPR